MDIDNLLGRELACHLVPWIGPEEQPPFDAGEEVKRMASYCRPCHREVAARHGVMTRLRKSLGSAASIRESPEWLGRLGSFACDLTVCASGGRNGIKEALESSHYFIQVRATRSADSFVVSAKDSRSGLNVSVEPDGEWNDCLRKRLEGKEMETKGGFSDACIALDVILRQEALHRGLAGGLPYRSSCDAVASACSQCSSTDAFEVLCQGLRLVARGGFRNACTSPKLIRDAINRALETAERQSETGRGPRGSFLSSFIDGPRLRRERVGKRQRTTHRPSGKRIELFDFDGTLASTLASDQGKKAFKRALGVEWPFRGWWGRPESVLPPVAPRRGPALPDYDTTLVHDERAMRVLVTGRLGRTSQGVETVLESLGVVMDREYFHQGDGDVAEFKKDRVTRVASEGVEQITFHEDSPEHLQSLAELSGSPNCNVDLTVVRACNHRAASVANQFELPFSCPFPSFDADSATTDNQWGRISTRGRYVRLIVPPQEESAAVPEDWRRNKAIRDGEDDFHITLINAKELGGVARCLKRVVGKQYAWHALHIALSKMSLEWEKVGLGAAASTDKKQASAFLVCNWEGGNKLRETVGLAPMNFHVTLGFRSNDVHGVSKDNHTVIAGLNECARDPETIQSRLLMLFGAPER